MERCDLGKLKFLTRGALRGGVILSLLLSGCGEEAMDAAEQTSQSAAVTTMLSLYLSATGSDSNSGTTSAAPLKNLWKAEQIIKSKGTLTGDVYIYVNPAQPIFGQSTYWDINLSNSSYKIYIKSQTATQAVFQGCNSVQCGCNPAGSCGSDLKAYKSDGSTTGGTSYWNRFISVDLPAGATKSNLVFDNLSIKNYQEGIYFSNAGNNIVQNCTLYKIGDGWGATSSGGTGYDIGWPEGDAAIHAINSSNNTFGPGNVFQINWNRTGPTCNGVCCPGCMHAIYLSAKSSNNMITDSTFDTISGDALRVRDSSNTNTFKKVSSGMTFKRTGQEGGGALSTFGSGTECNSWTNLLQMATIDKDRSCSTTPFNSVKDNACPTCTDTCKPAGATVHVGSSSIASTSACTCSGPGVAVTNTYLCCSNSSTGGICD